ncbi:MAG: hypothetical protein LBR39_00565 [Coriobacteriales bacterium]|nr:hypothetical protein [Coriobacteriales bacterium]
MVKRIVTFMLVVVLAMALPAVACATTLTGMSVFGLDFGHLAEASGWSVVNLLASALAAFSTLALFMVTSLRRKRSLLALLVASVMTLASLSLFVGAEDFSQPIVALNSYSLAHIIMSGLTLAAMLAGALDSRASERR